MLKAFNLIACLIGAWSIHAARPFSPQDDFSLGQRKMRNPAVVVVDLRHGTAFSNITVTGTTSRNESCKTTTTNYSLTDAPGRFFYHVPKFNTDVDLFVVDTNYVEHALLGLVSTERSGGNETLIAKLYSRDRNTTDSVWENFRTLVRRLGISDRSIIINQHRGQCERLTTETTQL